MNTGEQQVSNPNIQHGCQILDNGDVLLLASGSVIGKKMSDGSFVGFHPWNKGIIPAKSLKAMRDSQIGLQEDYDD